MALTVEIPYGWKPRPYQYPAWKAAEDGIKRFALCWHRRAGKDLWAINRIAASAFTRKGLYWHIFPTYRQGRNAVWLGSTKEGKKFLDHLPLHDQGVPNQLIKRKRDDEMTVWFANGSTYQVVGADDPDRLVGANPIGVVFSEWSLMNPVVWDLIRPILAENGGWAIFIYTPRGMNHGYKIYQLAKDDPDWFAQLLTIEDTGAVELAAIEQDRRSGMSEEMIQQEYYCSFEAPLVGSYYGEKLNKIVEEGRIRHVPWDSRIPVTTAWDIGYGDATAIWFAQQQGAEVRIIDYYQALGKGLEHYVTNLTNREYTYDQHLGPHDFKVHEWGSGVTRVEAAHKLGMRMRVIPKISLMDGINATRTLLDRCVFDEHRTQMGVAGLREYVKQPTGLEDPDRNPIYRDTPLHNWASHPADALRTLAVGLKPPREKREHLSPKLAIV